MRKTLLFAASFLLTLSAAAELDEAGRLRQVAEQVRAADGPVYVKDGGVVKQVSREAALADIYEDLAGIHYAQGQKEGEGAEEAGRALDEVKKKRFSADADAVTVDAKALENSSCYQHCTPTWLGIQNCRTVCTAVMAVRGGRKIDNQLDKDLSRMDAEVKEVSRGFMARSPGHMRATPYIRAGRLYADMAEAARAAGKKPAAAAPQAQAPAAAPAEFSPRKIYQKAGPAVVLLMCLDKEGQGELGTGSVIDDKGHVLTNAHVAINAATGKPYETIRVYLKPAKVTGNPKVDLSDPKEGRVLKYDRDLDLALIAVEGMPGLAPIPLGDAEGVEPGEPVVAIGHPEQGGLWTLTQGVVSTVVANLGKVDGKDVFQTDASINRGNSGGPLLDRAGAQIGVNTSMARKAADGLTITSVNFSVKSSVARKWLGNDVAWNAAAPAAEEPKAEMPKVAEKAPEAPKPVEAPKVAEKAPEAPKAEAPKPVEPPKNAEAPAVAKPAPVKPAIVTPAKPYKIEDLIEQEIAAMDQMGDDMAKEIEKRRGSINAPKP